MPTSAIAKELLRTALDHVTQVSRSRHAGRGAARTQAERRALLLARCLALMGAVTPAISSPAIAAPATANPSQDAGVPVHPGENRANVIFDDSTGSPYAVSRGAKARAATSFKLPLPARSPAGVRLLAPGTVNASLPDPEVMGFAQSGEVAYGGWQQDFNFSLLTTIAYAFVNVNSDGSLVTNDSGWSGLWSGSATSMIDDAHAAGDRVVVSISDHGNCGTSCANTLLGNATYRQNLIGSIVSLVSSRGIDGVNLDFEDATDTNGFTALVQGLRSTMQAQLAQSAYISVDTFASAYQGGELWNVPALVPYVDAIMPMAYDLNYGSTLPNAPLDPNSLYAYTDVGIVNGFLGQGVPASELILGVPYYGYVYSTSSAGFNAPRGGDMGVSAVTYSGALSDFACTSGPPDNLAQNWAPSAASPWAVWWSPPAGDPCGGNHNSYRELYYDNAQSLAAKYQLVNGDGLRGIGIWALGYDSGSNDLWTAIAQNFSVTHGPVARVSTLPATESSATFTVCWSVQGPSVHSILWSRDGSGPWDEVTDTTGYCTPFVGTPGHTYGFYVQTFDPSGRSWGPPGSLASATTTISSGAAPAAPFKALYAVDGNGLLHAGSSPPLPVSGHWPGWDVVRGIALDPDGLGGQVVAAFGGIHGFGNAPFIPTASYWPGWDIVRGIAVTPNAQGGYILDGFGGVHPFGNAPPVSYTGYWPGWNIARAIVLLPRGQSGYVLDGFGGLHPFGGAPAVGATGYWPGWDIARSIVRYTDTSGYVVDGFGGMHPYGGAPSVTMIYYAPGQYNIRGAALAP